jgi:hypothetical protein
MWLNFIITIISNINFNQFHNNQKAEIVFIYVYNYRRISEDIYFY